MILLGIDFGTTRTVVAAVDRGNYPVISFQTDDAEGGEVHDWYPSVVASRGNEIVYGFSAVEKQSDPEWRVLRSFKRQLGTVGPNEEIDLGGTPNETRIPTLELLTGFLAQLRQDLISHSNLRVKARE